MSYHDFFLNISMDDESQSRPRPNRNSTEKPEVVQVKSKKRKGGYRPVLVMASDLEKESLALYEPFRLINETCVREPGFMCQQDIVTYYLLVYLNHRYPNQLLESFAPILKNTTNDNHCESSKLFKDLPSLKFSNKNIHQRLEKLNIKTLFDLVNSFNLHSVPFSARYALVHWYVKNSAYHNLVLFINEIPSSQCVLTMQAEYKRCVSLISNETDRLVMNERDPLSFLLHDLVHAHKMFNSDYLLRGQVGFCRAVLNVFNDSAVMSELIDNDERLDDEFNYLISDMNSHPKHLFYYFKAILINGFKRRFGLVGSGEFLNGAPLDEFNKIFERVVNLLGMSGDEKELAVRMIVNEKPSAAADGVDPFNLIDFTLLDNFFLRLAAN
jgi:hypothetical protein